MPDRYENPENAEEATLAAALASENADAIDDTVEEELPVSETAEEVPAFEATEDVSEDTPETPAANENGENS